MIGVTIIRENRLRIFSFVLLHKKVHGCDKFQKNHRAETTNAHEKRVRKKFFVKANAKIDSINYKQHVEEGEKKKRRKERMKTKTKKRKLKKKKTEKATATLRQYVDLDLNHPSPRKRKRGEGGGGGGGANESMFILPSCLCATCAWKEQPNKQENTHRLICKHEKCA